MLQKGFFMTKPFNPNPYWDNTIINLVGAQKFDADTVFPRGRYGVDIQAGCSYYNGQTSVGKPGRIIKEINIIKPFVFRAYCGSMGTQNAAGINPYNGVFKVNAHTSATNVPAITHIFGNSGSPSLNPNTNAIVYCASGNCLGDGSYNVQGSLYQASGAGSCLHFIPVGGEFGSDYLAAFHVTASGTGYLMGTQQMGGGNGSAYGGAGSGVAFNSTTSGLSPGKCYSLNAGDTPYGTGGAGIYASGYNRGNNGTGIGFGSGGGESGGVGAWFDGAQWVDSRDFADVSNQDGHIVVTFLGPLN